MIGRLLRGAAACGVAAAGCLAAFLGWLGLHAEARPADALVFAGLVPDAVERSLEARLSGAETPDLEGAYRLAEPLLATSPLSEHPFRIAGLLALEAGDTRRADELFAIVHERQPRDSAARLNLVRRYLAGGDLATGVRELERLIWLDPSRSGQYADMLVALADAPEAAEAIEARMLESQPVRSALIGKMNERHGDIGRLIRLNAAEPPAQSGLVQRMLRDGGLEFAFLGWLEFLPADQRSDLSWPFNPRFEDVAAPAPFNWTVRTQLSEHLPDGGLYISYDGKDSPVLLEQTMMSAPQRYAVSLTMDVSIQPNGGQLKWSLACASGGPELGSVRIRERSAGVQTYRFETVAPGPDCRGMKLSLSGVPGEFPLWARATLRRAEMEPLTEEFAP
jgi:hypothetical protein